MTGRYRLGVAFVFGLALSGCHKEVASQRSTEVAPSKPRPPISKPFKADAKTPPTTQPVYIDLGPIETVALSSATISVSPPVTVAQSDEADLDSPDRSLSPSESVQARQLSLSSNQNVDLRVEQPSGTLSDRCDPAYWGGTNPPANLGCDSGPRVLSYTDFDRAPRPGTYVRFNQSSGIELDDAALTVGRAGERDVIVNDNAFGAILVVRDVNLPSQARAANLPENADEGFDPTNPIDGAAAPPSVLMP